MPRDSSGTYTLPDGYQAVTGELFVATQHNSPLEDIRDALTGSLARNGSGSMSAALDMNSNRIKNLADPTSDQDAVTKTYVDQRTWADAIDIASAATTDIGSKDSETVNVTGTEAITSLGTADAGVSRWVKFAGALTLTHNATSLILPTGANITTAAGDTAYFKSEGEGNWRCYLYQPADGEALKISKTGYTFAEGDALDTPASGEVVLYAKSDGRLYFKDDAGNERPVWEPVFVSEALEISAGVMTVPHGLSARPNRFQIELVNVSGGTRAGYANGEVAPLIAFSGNSDNQTARGFAVKADATNVYLRVGTGGVAILSADSGAYSTLTLTDWNVVVRAWS